LCSWRQSTKKQYAVYIRRWTKFCAEQKLPIYQTDVFPVLQFLTLIYEQTNSYSAINTARCALSSFITLDSGQTIGTHPLVSRFVKGVYNLHPPAPRYSEVWDVRLVLDYLRTLSPIVSLRLRDITLTLCMLIALLSAQRSQTLHLLRIDNMKLRANSVIFTVKELVKQSKPGNTGITLNLEAYPPDRRLCICRVLKHYLFCTKNLRKNSKQLFISYRKPHEPVGKETISRWIRVVLHKAGIDTSVYKAHSTRAASSSAARDRNVPISDILATAGWACEKTFTIYYSKPIHHPASKFSNVILHPTTK
jgi:hypothetical protein